MFVDPDGLYYLVKYGSNWGFRAETGSLKSADAALYALCAKIPFNLGIPVSIAFQKFMGYERHTSFFDSVFSTTDILTLANKIPDDLGDVLGICNDIYVGAITIMPTDKTDIVIDNLNIFFSADKDYLIDNYSRLWGIIFALIDSGDIKILDFNFLDPNHIYDLELTPYAKETLSNVETKICNGDPL